MEHMYSCYILCVCTYTIRKPEQKRRSACTRESPDRKRATATSTDHRQRTRKKESEPHTLTTRSGAQRAEKKQTRQNRHTAEASDKYARAFIPMPNRSGSLQLVSSCTERRKQIANSCARRLWLAFESAARATQQRTPCIRSVKVGSECQLELSACCVAIKFEFNSQFQWSVSLARCTAHAFDHFFFSLNAERLIGNSHPFPNFRRT